jgi:hypothetical protein
MKQVMLLDASSLNRHELNSENQSSGHTRRSFIKRTGGASIATLVAWSLLNESTKAGTGDTVPKASKQKILIKKTKTGSNNVNVTVSTLNPSEPWQSVMAALDGELKSVTVWGDPNDYEDYDAYASESGDVSSTVGTAPHTRNYSVKAPIKMTHYYKKLKGQPDPTGL